MKKNIFVMLMLIFASTILFSACNSTPSISGSFSLEEYVVSIDDTINFYDELSSLKGAEKSQIEIEVSNALVLSKQENGDFLAENAGQSMVFAKYKGSVFAQASVQVKNRFSSPGAISLQEDGTITWEQSFTFLDNEIIYASNYILEYADITNIADINSAELEFLSLTVQDSFKFEKIGSYLVRLKALSNTERKIDESDFCEEQIINYGVMGIIEDVEFQVSQSFGDNSATISWLEKKDAQYQIFINGLSLPQTSTTNSFTYDFSALTDGQPVQIDIVSSDRHGIKLSSTSTLMFNKLIAPQYQYNTSNQEDQDGYLYWEQIANSQGYRVSYENIQSGDSDLLLLTDEQTTKINLEGFASGVYSLSFQTIGGTVDNNFYLNSHATENIYVAKLAVPVVDISFEGSTAVFTFEENYYNSRYLVKYADKSVIIDGQSGRIELNDLPVGDYTFDITALPVLANGEIVSFVQDDVSTDYILSSDSYKFDFHILNQFSSLTHSLNENQTTSTFTTNRIEGASYYELYINGVLREDASMNEAGEYVSFTLNNLRLIEPVDNSYSIKVVAGIREDGIEKAVLVEVNKTLKILPLVSESQNQTNGYYTWQEIDNDYAYYSYEIYKTESNFIIGSEDQPIKTGGTSENTINEALEFGYYVIRIATTSSNYNNYLDSDFVDSDNYFEDTFIVERQIETPNVTFAQEGELYKLYIDSVDYAGEFEVYVDGLLDKTITYTQSEGRAEYIFNNNFSQEGHSYNVEVIAKSGSYDSTLHTPSSPYELTVTRLTQPQFTVSEGFAVDGQKNAENLQVEMVENAEYSIIALDGVTVNTDKSHIYNLIGQDNEFEVTLSFKAVANEGDNYYLDSHTRNIVFNRVSSPRNIAYYDGELTWDNSDDNIENYYLGLTLLNQTNGNVYYRILIEGNVTSIDLQALIEQLCTENQNNFNGNYSQAEGIMIDLYAYKNGFVEDIYSLPSTKGSTTGNQNYLTLEMLEPAEITFDEQKLTINWAHSDANTTYDVYVDGSLIIEDYTSNVLHISYLEGLEGFNIDFDTQRSIYIVSKNPYYLNSEESNTIRIKQLKQIDSLNVTSVNDIYYLSFSLEQDLSYISQILVNGSTDNVTYSRGDNGGSFSLENVSTDNFEFQVIALNNELSSDYYYNSNITTFTLIDIDTLSFEVSLDDDIISWNALASDFIGADINPIVYTLSILSNGERHTITTTETQYLLQDIETQLNTILSGNVEITVTERVDKAYSLTLTDGQAKGYYGENQAEVILTEKLVAIDQISKRIVDDSSAQTMIASKQNAHLELSWNDLWAGYEGQSISFEITISPLGQTAQTFVLTDGTVYPYLNLVKQQDMYVLTVSRELLQASQTDFSIKVLSTNLISSQPKEISLSKIATTPIFTVDQNGVLTILDSENSAYIVEVTIGDVLYENTYSFSQNSTKQINLLVEGILLGSSGSYSIRVMAYDSTNNTLPSDVSTIQGTKLQGISSYSIEDDGYLYMYMYPDDFSGMYFTFRMQINGIYYSVDITPDTTEVGTNFYQVYMQDLLDIFLQQASISQGLYSFEITVAKTGSVRADYITVPFYYQIDNTTRVLRGLDLSQDYFVFDLPENDNIVSINFKLYALNSQNSLYEHVENLSISAESSRGFWCQNEETGEQYFSKERDDSLENVTYTECYAVSINELFADYEYGMFYIEVSRLGLSDETYYLYSKYQTQITKLNRIYEDPENEVKGIQIAFNVAFWLWEPAEELNMYSDYAPSAYYVIIESAEEGDNQTLKYITYSASFDLREANLTPGKNYRIYVMAVSSNSNIIASDKSLTYDTVLKYTTPLSLDVDNGKIVFDIDLFKASNFFTTIENYFGTSSHTEELYDIMAFEKYTSPYYFEAAQLGNFNLVLRFTALDNSGAETSTYYEMTVPAYMLLPDITITNRDTSVTVVSSMSYIDLLGEYLTTFTETTLETIYFTTMVNAMQSSNRGLAGDGILFDDFGRLIPAGKYSLSAYQLGGGNIDSDMSSVTTIFVTASPSMTIGREADQNSNNYYTATFGNTETYIASNFDGLGNATEYTLTTATQYKMLLRYDFVSSPAYVSYSSCIEFTIRYIESVGWQIYYDDQLLNGVISDVEGSGAMPGFKINATTLRSAFDQIMAENGIEINQMIRVDVYAYSGDNGYVVNGKSASFNLRYLDLPTDDITFQNGVMTIRTTLDSTNSILMRYRASGSELATQIVQLRNGVAEIELPRTGAYSYIVLSLSGSYSQSTINVESKTYAIENLYKLSAPTLSTQSNNLYITYNTNDLNYSEDQSIQFYMANNVSLSNGTGYYFTSNLHRGQTSITHQVGSKDAQTGAVNYPSELTATSFQAYLLGNSGYFVASDADDNTEHGADYVWTFMTLNSSSSEYEEGYMIFSSDYGTINASMLNVLTGGIGIHEGDVLWNVVDNLPQLENGEIVYEVNVNYYKQAVSSSGNTIYEYQRRDTYYTSLWMLASEYISQDYDYYIIDVTPLGCRHLSSQEGSWDPRAIQTLEGEYFLYYDSVNYANGGQVLRGNTLSLGTTDEPISRTTTPVLTPSDNVINNGISNGNIIYYITTEDYGGQISDENNDNVASRTIITAHYTQADGTESSQIITGEYSFSSSNLSGVSGYVMVTFTPDEGQLSGISPFSIGIQMYTEDSLLSKSLVINNVYKMTNISQNYYSVRLNGDQTIIDFTNYFRYISIASNNSCYRIVVDYNTSDIGWQSTVITSSSTLKTFEIANNVTEISIQIRDNQDASATNRIKILYSDTLTFIVEQTVVQSAAGEDLIEIHWDNLNYRFIWNWTDDRDPLNYEYYYQIKMEGTQVVSGTVSTNYYIPGSQGRVESFLIKARQLNIDEGNENILHIYSNSIIFTSNQSIVFQPFSGGDGSEENPYLISNAEEFYNISKRNTLGESFKFKLTSNIEVDMAQMISLNQGQVTYLIKEFYGNLDGDGYQISLNANELYDMDSSYTASMTGSSSSITFNKYFALFYTVASSASLRNLQINLTVNLNSEDLSNTSAIISPLALYNYGTISGIVVNNVSITSLLATGNLNHVFIGGIAGINYGTIQNSINSSNLTYSTPQRVIIYFGYSAIALFNNVEGDYRGTISNCFNRGSVSITIGSSYDYVYISGITFNSQGSLDRVGNDGDFTVSGLNSTTSYTAYLTGIALLCSGGSISYSYNNGQFASLQGNVSLNVAGIAYTISGGTINTLVDTQSNALVSVSRIRPTDLGRNYASLSSGTTAISFEELTQTQIDCGNGYYLNIQRASDGSYFANISNS